MTTRGHRLPINVVWLGVGGVWCWWRIRALGDVRLHLAAFYGWFTLAFISYLAALWLIRRSEQAPCARRMMWSGLGVIGVVAVAARLCLLGTTPTLSDDIYRYRWDGRVQLAGIDPYAYPPDAPALASLRDELSPRINFPHLRTVYPPLNELAFRAGAMIGHGLTGQKIVFLCVELITIMSILFILHRRKRSLWWIAAYAWHPLVILEIAGSGHNDALGVALLWAGLAAYEPCRGQGEVPSPAGMGRGMRLRWFGVTLAWSGAFLSKFASALLVPWWWFRRQGRGWLMICAVLSMLPLLAHPTMISALTESLSAMTVRFESNASLYLALVWIAHSAAFGRIMAVTLLAAFSLWWARRQDDPIAYLLGVFSAAALLSPVLHPWYVVWLIPCFCFYRVPALLALSGTVVLAYTVWPGRLADGHWAIPLWAHGLEYAPVVLLGMWELHRCKWDSSFRFATKRLLSAKS